MQTRSLIILCCAVGLLATSLWGAPETVRFTDLGLLTNGEANLQVAASNGSLYRLEVSTNLLDWDGWITARTSGSDELTDSGAPYRPIRYYRALPLEGTNHLTGDHLSTENGDVIFHVINHASLVLSWNGLMIYNDPVGGSALYAGLAPADLSLVSHAHGDHYNSPTLTAVRAPGGVIVAPPDVYGRLPQSLQTAAASLPNDAATNLMGIHVEAVRAYNGNHPIGNGNGYVITLGGKRIYFSGDTGDIAEMRALTGIDVAFVCMNVPFTMTVQEAASAVREFRPRIIYPYHYRNQNGTYADLQLFKQLVGTDGGVEVRIRDWY